MFLQQDGLQCVLIIRHNNQWNDCRFFAEKMAVFIFSILYIHYQKWIHFDIESLPKCAFVHIFKEKESKKVVGKIC